MATVQNDAIEWLRSIHNIALQASIEGNARISTWLVVGNAGALVLIFQALISGSSCNLSQIAPSIWLFIGGLFSSFLAVALGALVGGELIKALGDMINTLWHIEKNESDLAEIEAKFGPQPDDSILNKSIAELNARSPEQMERMRAVQRRARRLIGLQGLSIIFFALGVLWPAINPDLIATCAASPTLEASAVLAEPVPTHHICPECELPAGK